MNDRLKDFFYLIYNQNGMEFSKEEIRLIISAVEQYYNIEREYKSQYKHNMEVTFPLLKKLEKLK